MFGDGGRLGVVTSTAPTPSPLWQHSPAELAQACVAELAAARAATARMGAVLVEMDTRGFRDLFGYGSAASWLADTAGISRDEAGKTVNRAKKLNAGRHPDGTVEPALAPLTGAAALEGALSTANIDLITTTLRTIPAEHREFAEATLVELARVAGPRQVRTCADDLLARLDPDGPQPNDDDPGPQRPTLALRERKDGWWDLDGRVDPITGRRLRGTLDPLATARPQEEELPDLRSPAERDGDAFGELMALVQSAPGVSHADRAQMIVTIPLTPLQQGLAGACLDFTTTLSATEARMLACDCAITPAVLGTAGEPLDIGRAQHLITPTPAQSPRATRPRLQLPRLPPQTQVLRGSPHPSLVPRWAHRPAQPLPALHPPPPTHPPSQMGHPHRRRRGARVHPARVHRRPT